MFDFNMGVIPTMRMSDGKYQILNYLNYVSFPQKSFNRRVFRDMKEFFVQASTSYSLHLGIWGSRNFRTKKRLNPNSAST
jgi:hypothetical protein